MLMYMMEWDIIQEKIGQYRENAKEDLKALKKVKGLKEMRGYYNLMQGSPQVVIMMEFEDLASWENWMRSELADRIFAENRKVTTNFRDMILGPSPIMQQPVSFDD